jgi:hypothetical protein
MKNASNSSFEREPQSSQEYIWIDDPRIKSIIINSLRGGYKDLAIGMRVATNSVDFTDVSQFGFPNILSGLLWLCITEQRIPWEVRQIVENLGRMIAYPTTGATVLALSNYHALISEIAAEFSVPNPETGKSEEFALVGDSIRYHQVDSNQRGIFITKEEEQEKVIVVQEGKTPHLRRQRTHYLPKPAEEILLALVAGVIHMTSTEELNLLKLFAVAKTTRGAGLETDTYVNFLMPARILAYLASHSEEGITYGLVVQIFYGSLANTYEESSRHFLDSLEDAGFVEKVPVDVSVKINLDRELISKSKPAISLLALLRELVAQSGDKQITYKILKQKYLLSGTEQDYLDGIKILRSKGIISYLTNEDEPLKNRYNFKITGKGIRALSSLRDILIDPLSYVFASRENLTTDDIRDALYRVRPGKIRSVAEMPVIYGQAFNALNKARKRPTEQ